MLALTHVIDALTYVRLPGTTPVIPGAFVDSRQVIPGGLFVAIPGENVDGHNYVADAFQRGASFALIERDVQPDLAVLDLRGSFKPTANFKPQAPLCLRVDNTVTALQKIASYWRKKLDLCVIGITGSVGKSTTKEVIAEVLSQRYRTLKTYGNQNNEIGLPLTILRLSEGHQCAVLEMGFYVPGEIALLCEIANPQIGVITNIGTVHAERAGSQQAIFKGKSELVQSLNMGHTAILNRDDPWVAKMAALTKANIFWYGMTPEADLWADQVTSHGLDGIRLRLHYRNESLYARVPMIGRHSVQTVLRAAAVGLTTGLTWEEIINGLQQSQAQLRLVAIKTSSGALVLDDTYNATPESTLAALNLLAELDGRRIAVLGDMLELGQYEQQGHESVGMRAAEIADILITVGKRGKMISAAAHKAGMSKDQIISFDATIPAANWLVKNLLATDTVLIKGSNSLRMDKIVSRLEAAQ